MNNKKRTIIICIAIIIGIILTGFFVWNSESIQITFGKDYDFEKDYELYQEYADIYVKTWKTDAFEEKLLERYSGDLVNQTVEISSDINIDFILITVDGSLSKVIAKYPIEFITEEDKSFKINILYDDGTYENSKKIDTIPECCFLLIMTFIVITGIFYNAILFIVSAINSLILFIKKKKYK